MGQSASAKVHPRGRTTAFLVASGASSSDVGTKDVEISMNYYECRQTVESINNGNSLRSAWLPSSCSDVDRLGGDRHRRCGQDAALQSRHEAVVRSIPKLWSLPSMIFSISRGLSIRSRAIFFSHLAVLSERLCPNELLKVGRRQLPLSSEVSPPK